jgi:hypothetical protein
MPLPVWIGLGVLVLATVGGAVYVFIHGRETWQTFRKSGGTVDDALNDMLDRLARVEERAGTLESAGPRVEESLERLRASTEVLKTELRVLQDVRAPLMRFRAVLVPRK